MSSKRRDRTAVPPKRSAHNSLILAPLLFVACGGARDGAPQVDVALPSTKPEVKASRVLEAKPAELPRQLVVDGRLDEWALGAAAPPVAVALHARGIAVAARLPAGDDGAIWIGIQVAPSALPPVGTLEQVGGSVPEPVMGVVLLGCNVSSPDEPERPSADCLASRAAREADERAHAERFRRWLRLEPGKASFLDERGQLTPLPGAEVARAAGLSGAILEASLPLLAYPRLAEAPLSKVSLTARTGALSGRDLPALLPHESEVALSHPLAFEPRAALRAAAFKRSAWLSYHPAELEHVEALRYPPAIERLSYDRVVEPLFTKLADVGPVEVGTLAVAPPPDDSSTAPPDRVALAAIGPKGTQTAAIHGALLATERRGGALHVLSYASERQMVHDGSPDASFLPADVAEWSCLVVQPSGVVESAVLGGEDRPFTWNSVEEVHDATSLGFLGDPAVWPEGDTLLPGWSGGLVEFRWRWDQRRGAYVPERPKKVKR